MEKRKNESQFELEIRRRVEAKYDERNALLIHLISYAGVNILVWMIWLFAAGGFPWPLFVTLFWGIGLAGHLLDYYNKHGGGAQRREERIQEEVQRHLERLEEREREIYGDDEMDDALDDVERRHLRLSDDGELVQFDIVDEDGDIERDRRA
ncbi:MAG: 2TM domain-containing protein [Chloroflexi bacterium]|nr:2TM domain-containing protein [Chloroflexota bacterium]MCY3978181.1 2TM domain-containing protein [Chloroflexota bacterium]MDE2637615.1 2TM domain-containing protein [Chloroflexota bacterium]